MTFDPGEADIRSGGRFGLLNFSRLGVAVKNVVEEVGERRERHVSVQAVRERRQSAGYVLVRFPRGTGWKNGELRRIHAARTVQRPEHRQFSSAHPEKRVALRRLPYVANGNHW